MPKDDLFANRTLWIDREGMDMARERFWQAYHRIEAPAASKEDQHTWTVAWAAAVAAFSFVMEGNLGPKGEDGQ